MTKTLTRVLCRNTDFENNGKRENTVVWIWCYPAFVCFTSTEKLAFAFHAQTGGFGFRVSRPNSGRRQARVVKWISPWGIFCWGNDTVGDGRRRVCTFSISALRPCKAWLELEIYGLADSLQRTRELGLLCGHGARRLFGAKMSC